MTLNPRPMKMNLHGYIRSHFRLSSVETGAKLQRLALPARKDHHQEHGRLRR